MVCRDAFVSIHGVTPGRVRHLAFYAKTSPTPPVDGRGKQMNPQGLGQSIKHQISNHIKSFPTVKSHYGRSSTTRGRKYLSPYLSVAAMHELYLKAYEPAEFEKLQRGEPINPTVKYDYYRTYFNTHFNLAFGTPKVDTCTTCDEVDTKMRDVSDANEKKKLQEEKELHLRQAQQFYTELRTSTQMARDHDDIASISFDFEQNFPLPHIPTGEVFYLRQVWLYVFGVHDCGDNTAAMFCWPENLAHKGANEVVSCLHSYLNTLRGVKRLNLFSDSCGGQNKNSTVIQYLYTLVRNGHFHHVFPVRGHSFLPCDRDFAKTETKKRRVERVYTPQQWMDIVRSARKKKPYNVVEVNQSMILNFQLHFSQFFKKTVTNRGERMRIREARLFEYSQDHPQEVWVKYSLCEEDEWHKFRIEKRGACPTFPTELAYSALLPLTQEKVDDVKKLVYKYVPREFREFYDHLISVNLPETDSSV